MIALTGATGLLGSFVLEKFIKENIPVKALTRNKVESKPNVQWIEGDILDIHSLRSLFENVDTVIHVAGLVSFNPKKRDLLMEINMGGTRNVVNMCLASNVKRLIHISSVAALGRQRGINILNEESKWIESPLNSHYAKSKYLAELEAFRGQEEGLQVSVIYPSVVLAPGPWERSSSQIFKYVWNEKMFFTEGLTNYVDVRDVVEIIYQVYHQKKVGEKFIASGGAISFEQLFQKIATRFKKRAPRFLVPKSLTYWAGFLEEIKSSLLGKEPLISRQSARMTGESFIYDNKKSIEQIPIQYHTLKETLDWCCSYYLETYNTNK